MDPGVYNPILVIFFLFLFYGKKTAIPSAPDHVTGNLTDLGLFSARVSKINCLSRGRTFPIFFIIELREITG